MKIKCTSDAGMYKVSLRVGKVYEATFVADNWYALVDETGDEYGFPAALFEVVEE